LRSAVRPAILSLPDNERILVDANSVDKAAGALLGAYASRTPVPPLTASDPGLSVSDAYAIQLARVAAWISGGAVLGSPVNALVWLANVLGERGVTLEAGHVVLPGSVCAAIPFGPGDTVSATFDRIGSVTVTFAEKS
jgi:2-keto-4-pentenoate hydratase